MQQLDTSKKDLVGFFLKKGLLVNEELLEKLEDKTFFDNICKLIEENKSLEVAVLDQKIKQLLEKPSGDVNWQEVEKFNAITQKKNKNTDEVYSDLTTQEIEEPLATNKVKVVASYNTEAQKRNPQDFVDHFLIRYRSLAKVLRQRPELQNPLSINRLYNKRDREQVTLIGMVRDKQTTKNGNYMLTIEDETGYIRVIVNKTKPSLFNQTRDIVLDEVIGVQGVNGDNIVFANSITFPDIPMTTDLKKADEEEYVMFLSDIHVGSIDFLHEDFNRFLKWINQEIGTEQQKAVAAKVKYIFVLGDLVDGVGVYPDQDKELTIKDLREQYEACAHLLRKIPKSVQLIICPGNHDAMRVAEPQLPFYKDFATALYEIENATIVSNPAIINIAATETFPGFDVLIYHGYSFDYYVAEVESIRNSGGYDRPDLVMKYLLQKRHLAPNHTSTLYVPDTEKDPLFIGDIPDFFAAGHIHKSAIANYRNITMIMGSCWQRKTAFQEKVGHHPEPSRVPIVNLKTREARMLKFGE